MRKLARCARAAAATGQGERYQQWVEELARAVREDTRPAVCAWLSRETHVLPAIVNIVYMVSLKSDRVEGTLDMVRLAQYMPNTSYARARAAAITMRIGAVTAMFYMGGTLTVISARRRWQSIYYSHLYRQVIERVPILVHDANDPERTMRVEPAGNYIGYSGGAMQNVVASGTLPQDGVNLDRLIEANPEDAEYDPDAFINLFYSGKVADGRRFCANIANTGKVVIMGLNTVEAVYEAYKMVCDVVHDFEDPNVPADPIERHRYRMRALAAGGDPRFGLARGAIEEDKLIAGDGDNDSGDEEGNFMDRFMSAIGIAPEERPVQQKAALDVGGRHDDNDDQDPRLLVRAARGGQVDNVRFILSQPDTDMAREALLVDPETGVSVVLQDLWRIQGPTPPQMAATHCIELFVREHAGAEAATKRDSVY